MILEQSHTEIPEEERHILSLSVHYLSVDNFWGLRPSGGKDRADLYERLSLAHPGGVSKVVESTRPTANLQY
jgi:hypothetical protein